MKKYLAICALAIPTGLCAAVLPAAVIPAAAVTVADQAPPPVYFHL